MSKQSDPNTQAAAAQNRQIALFDAYDEYLERVQLYAGIARDYGSAADLTGMVYALKQTKAYLKAANGELAEIIAERVHEAAPAQAAPAKTEDQTKEWWNE